jgi:hypothetical protein
MWARTQDFDRSDENIRWKGLTRPLPSVTQYGRDQMRRKPYVARWRVLDVPGRLEPAIQLKDTIKITSLQIPTIIISSLTKAGIETIGQVRRKSDQDLRTIRGIGPDALRYLRDNLGAASDAARVQAEAPVVFGSLWSRHVLAIPVRRRRSLVD